MQLLLDGQNTNRLMFRTLTPSDFNAWLPFHQDPKTSQYWSGLPSNPMTACTHDFERTFHRYANHMGGKLALILKGSDTLIGLSGLLVQNIDGVAEIEIAYSLLPKYWRQGFALEAALKCKELASSHRLAASLVSIIHIHNIPSQRVAQKLGMAITSTTTYHNNPVHIYRILL